MQALVVAAAEVDLWAYEPDDDDHEAMDAAETRIAQTMRRKALEQVVAKMTPAQKATASLVAIIAAVRAVLAGGIDYDVDYDENGDPSNAQPYLRVSPGAVFEKAGSASARLHVNATTVVAVDFSRARSRESAPRPSARSSRRTTAARGSPGRRTRAGDGDPDPPGLTALQRASARFGEALAIAHADERTLEVFLDIVAIRTASEHARRWAA
jgi:hypothetical protein